MLIKTRELIEYWPRNKAISFILRLKTTTDEMGRTAFA